MTGRVTTVPVRFLDSPDGYPPVRSRSSMVVPLPERLRVALHKQSLGAYLILGDDEGYTATLWMTVEYERVGDDHDGRYRLRSQPEERVG